MEKVLITGCSRGFGYEMALLLAQNDFIVTASTRHVDFQFPDSIKHQYLDVLDLPSEIDDFDIVIFNAGVLDAGLAENISSESIEKMLQTNVESVMKLSQLVIPKMKEKQKGKLIFISSQAARRPLPNLSVYNATKAAIEGYAKSLYLELAPFNIEVFLVEPSFYKTSLWNNISESQDDYSQFLNYFSKKFQKDKDMKEVTFQILKICQGKVKRLHIHFSILDKIILFFSPLMYTKIGKTAIKRAYFNFRK